MDDFRAYHFILNNYEMIYFVQFLTNDFKYEFQYMCARYMTNLLAVRHFPMARDRAASKIHRLEALTCLFVCFSHSSP